MSEREILQEGTRIDGRYTLREKLGAGGFATVYRGFQDSLDREVAIKILDLPETPTRVDSFIRRFMREAQVAAAFEHPNIVSIYDYGVLPESGQPYIVMEMLKGYELQEVIDRGPMPVSTCMEWLLPCLDAIAEAHHLGIVHKDLKPSNLFIHEPGTRKEKMVVLDFGVARLYTEDDARITRTGAFAGTPAYLAPEYIEKQIVTPALDVYQLGLILVEMLTGKPAVSGDSSMSIMLKHCDGDLRIPRWLINSILGPVILKAVALDHTRRYPDAQAFLDALETIKPTHLVIAPDPAEEEEQTVEYGRRESREMLQYLDTADTVHALPVPEGVRRGATEPVVEEEPEEKKKLGGLVLLVFFLALITGGTLAYWTMGQDWSPFQRPSQPLELAPLPAIEAAPQAQPVAVETAATEKNDGTENKAPGAEKIDVTVDAVRYVGYAWTEGVTRAAFQARELEEEAQARQKRRAARQKKRPSEPDEKPEEEPERVPMIAD